MEPPELWGNEQEVETCLKICRFAVEVHMQGSKRSRNAGCETAVQPRGRWGRWQAVENLLGESLLGIARIRTGKVFGLRAFPGLDDEIGEWGGRHVCVLLYDQPILRSPGRTACCWHRQPKYVCTAAGIVRLYKDSETLKSLVVAAPADLGEMWSLSLIN